MSGYDPVKIKSIKPLHDHVIVSDMNFRERLSTGGIIIKSDDKTTQGIRPRWGRVYAIGPKQQDVQVGQWILVSHGRWTRGVTIEDDSGQRYTIRRVDNKDILMVSDEQPGDDTIGD